jgi:DNA-binding protein HU-beta
MAKMMTKSELIQKITDQHSDLTKKDVKAVMETLATVAYRELKKTGAFLLPGFAKFVVIKKPATKERAGINPPRSRQYSRRDRRGKSLGHARSRQQKTQCDDYDLTDLPLSADITLV